MELCVVPRGTLPWREPYLAGTLFGIDLCAPCKSYASYPSLMLLILGQALCFLSKAYASYTILMYMPSYEYEICRPFSVPDNIIL